MADTTHPPDTELVAYGKMLDELVAPLKEKTERWEQRVKQLPPSIPIDDTELADRVQSAIPELRKWRKHVDDARKAQLQPWNDRRGEVLGRYKPLVDMLDSMGKFLKPLHETWHKAVRDKAENEARALEAAAAKKEKEATGSAEVAQAAAARSEAQEKRESGQRVDLGSGTQAHMTKRLNVEVTDMTLLLKAIIAGEVSIDWVAAIIPKIKEDVRLLELTEAPGLKIEYIESSVVR